MTGCGKFFLIVISNICKRHKRVLARVTPALGQSAAVERTTKGHGLDVATLKICFIKRTSLNFLFPLHQSEISATEFNIKYSVDIHLPPLSIF